MKKIYVAFCFLGIFSSIFAAEKILTGISVKYDKEKSKKEKKDIFSFDITYNNKGENISIIWCAWGTKKEAICYLDQTFTGYNFQPSFLQKIYLKLRIYLLSRYNTKFYFETEEFINWKKQYNLLPKTNYLRNSLIGGSLLGAIGLIAAYKFSKKDRFQTLDQTWRSIHSKTTSVFNQYIKRSNAVQPLQTIQNTTKALENLA